MLDEVEQALSRALQSEYGLTLKPRVSRTPNLKFGDVAWNCAETARQHELDATEMAKALAIALATEPFVHAASVKGSFLNIAFDKPTLFKEAVENAGTNGQLGVERPERIMVEYLSPNTNKPLHLGHVRNGVLGSALSNILESAGHTIIRANLVNDRGAHICKSMLAYQQFGDGKTPESTGTKGDHFVGDWYVRYGEMEKAAAAEGEAAKTALKERLDAMLQAWEAGDLATLALWKRMNDWVYDGFGKTYEDYGFRFDVFYYESNLYTLGKDIVEDGLARSIFTQLDNGSVSYSLPVATFGTDKKHRARRVILLRGDGTSLYTTQDLGTALRKVQDYGLDRSIYVVASEQNSHFAALFQILKELGYPWATRCYHFSYGMVELPHGRMKSREGTVVDADDLLEEMAAIAARLVREKSGEDEDSQPGGAAALSEESELQRRSHAIALSAIKMFMLNFSPATTVKFDPEKSLAFEGDTGPYCLYTYARTQSILAKAAESGLTAADGDLSLLGTEDERTLALEILEFPRFVLSASEAYNPTLVAKKVISLARAFNRFYKTHQVVGSEAAVARDRLAIVRAVAETLEWGLSLLGIGVLERM